MSHNWWNTSKERYEIHDNFYQTINYFYFFLFSLPKQGLQNQSSQNGSSQNDDPMDDPNGFGGFSLADLTNCGFLDRPELLASFETSMFWLQKRLGLVF